MTALQNNRKLYRFIYFIKAKPHVSLSILIHLILFILICWQLPNFDFSLFRKQETVVLIDLVNVGDNTNIQIASDQKKNLFSADQKIPKPKSPQRKSTEASEKLPVAGEKVIKKSKKKPAPTAKERKDNSSAQSTLKAVRNVAKSVPMNNSDQKKTGTTGKGKVPYSRSKPQTASLIDSIRSQFIHCWSIPHGALDVENMRVKVDITLDEDGKVLDARVMDIIRYQQDAFFRAMADSSLRAVHMCSPLQGLPKDQHDLWGTLELVFDPQDMF